MADDAGTGPPKAKGSDTPVGAPSPVAVATKAFATSWGAWLILGAIVLAVITVVVGTSEPPKDQEPNRLATSLLQAITLVFGTLGSYIIGKDASEEAVRRRVQPHARSAFRRVQTLYGALGRLRLVSETEATFLRIKSDQGAAPGHVPIDLALASLDKVRLMSLEHIATGEDALEDWRDLAPDEVAAIEAKALLLPNADTEEVPQWPLTTT